jgi:hypothetical protein
MFVHTQRPCLIPCQELQAELPLHSVPRDALLVLRVAHGAVRSFDLERVVDGVSHLEALDDLGDRLTVGHVVGVDAAGKSLAVGDGLVAGGAGAEASTPGSSITSAIQRPSSSRSSSMVKLMM